MLVPVKVFPSPAVKWMTDTYGLTVSMGAWADTLLHETPMKANRKRKTAATTSKNITLDLLELLVFIADPPLLKFFPGCFRPGDNPGIAGTIDKKHAAAPMTWNLLMDLLEIQPSYIGRKHFWLV
jgi:hypothetical protein